MKPIEMRYGMHDYLIEVDGGDVKVSREGEVIATGFWAAEVETVIDCRGATLSHTLWERIDSAIVDAIEEGA